MANRRMFSIKIINSDAFLSMRPSARHLYVMLNMWADDDGFVDSPRVVMRLAQASAPDMKTLIERGFLIPFGNGVVAVTHWRAHNLLRKDRHVPTRYQAQLARLTLKPGGEYALSPAPPAERAADARAWA